MAKSIKEFKNIEEFSKMCKNSSEPNIVIKYETGHLLVMPLSDYQEEPFNHDVYESLERGAEQLKNGAPTVNGHDYIKELKAQY